MPLDTPSTPPQPITGEAPAANVAPSPLPPFAPVKNSPPVPGEQDLNVAELRTDAAKLETDVEADIAQGKKFAAIFKADGPLGLITHIEQISGLVKTTVRDAELVAADVKHLGWDSPPTVILLVSILAPIALTGLGHEIPAWQGITGIIGSGILAIATVFAHKFAGSPPVLPGAAASPAPVPPVAPGSKSSP